MKSRPFVMPDEDFDTSTPEGLAVIRSTIRAASKGFSPDKGASQVGIRKLRGTPRNAKSGRGSFEYNGTRVRMT